MDLLLQRGQEAMDNEDYEAAIEHFTALTDHAPDFAEAISLKPFHVSKTTLMARRFNSFERPRNI